MADSAAAIALQQQIDAGGGPATLRVYTAAYGAELLRFTLDTPSSSQVYDNAVRLKAPRAPAIGIVDGAPVVAAIHSAAGTRVYGGMTVGTEDAEVCLSTMVVKAGQAVSLRLAQFAPIVVAQARSIVGARNHWPMYYQAGGTNTVNHYRVKRYVQSEDDFDDIELIYAGFTALFTEGATTAPFTLRAGVEYQGQFYPAEFAGLRDVTVGSGKFLVKARVPDLVLLAGTSWYERPRLIMNAANDNILVCSNVQRAHDEWAVRGTNTAIDYTLGGEPGYGAAGSFTIDAGGNITAVVTTAGGSGYSGTSVQLGAYDPDTGVSNSSIAFLTVTSGVVSVGTKTTGLSNTAGWGPRTRPYYGSGPITADAPSATSAAYHASLVTGRSRRKQTRSYLLIGNSNTSGYGSTDGNGDERRSFGVIERALAPRYGVAQMSGPGTYASTYLMATWPTIVPELKRVATHVAVQPAGNDIAQGDSLSTVQNRFKAIAAEWRAAGKLVAYVTDVPRTTGTYTSAAGQTPAAGHGPGGVLDQHNAAIRSGASGMTSDFPFIDLNAAARDPSNPSVWRSDGGVAHTNDGTHSNWPIGLTKIAADLAGSIE